MTILLRRQTDYRWATFRQRQVASTAKECCLLAGLEVTAATLVASLLGKDARKRLRVLQRYQRVVLQRQQASMSVRGVRCATSGSNIVAIADAFVAELAVADFVLIVMSQSHLQI